MSHVLLSGGIYHPFAECAAWMAEALNQPDTLITEQVETALDALRPGDLFTLYALRFRMLNDPKYQPFIEEWGFSMPAAMAAKLESFIHEGGSMLAMHTASICFDNWPEYSKLLGGHWQWGTSFHPPLAAIEVEPVGSHPIVADISPFRLTDEVYHHLSIEPDSEPLLRARVIEPPDTASDDWQTVAWAHEPGAGRVVYNALGHNADSLNEPMHTGFLNQSLGWLKHR